MQALAELPRWQAHKALEGIIPTQITVTARYSEGSVNPKVRYSEGSLFRRSVIPKVR